MESKIMDRIELYKSGERTYAVLINGWEFLHEVFWGYDSEQDIIDTIKQRVADHFNTKPENINFV